MTQEEKELLLKDLCARLYYEVKGIITSNGDKNIFTLKAITKKLFLESAILFLSGAECCHVEDFKPYLRPMSSMTEEERDELWHLSEEYFGKAIDKQIEESLSSSNRNESEILEYIASSVIVDWLNVHHFDHRGLIEKDLALEAPEGMYE